VLDSNSSAADERSNCTPEEPSVLRSTGRDAVARLRSNTRLGGRDGFTFVEIVIGMLVVGILAAIVVFSVATFTHRGPDPKCTSEVTAVDNAIAQYKAHNNNTNPASLDTLVEKKLLPAVPSASTPSGAAGYKYDPATGTYGGASCPSR
jgi:general secretion pathway protein G